MMERRLLLKEKEKFVVLRLEGTKAIVDKATKILKSKWKN